MLKLAYFLTKFNFFNIYVKYSGTIQGKFSCKSLDYNKYVSTFQMESITS